MDGDVEGAATLSTSAQELRGDSTLSRGASWSRYLVLEPLGTGAAGTVYSAYDPRLDRRVALKLLREATPRSRERFLREMRALARLQHRHVVTLYDAAEIDGRPYLAMELCPGGTLVQWCDRATRTPGEIVEAFLDAGEGLAAAHAAGFVHRDFKPANVLIGGDGRPRVGDFGLVRRAPADADDEPTAAPELGGSGITASGARVGTLAYMASEQLRGEPATAASDQFAYGVSLYRALFRRPPFAGADAAALLAAIADGPQPPPIQSRLEQRIWRVLRRSLAPAPEARFATMAELLAALRRAGRRRAGVRVALAVAVVALGAGAVAWRSAQPPTCGDAGAQLAGVWDAPRRLAVAAAFFATGRAHAEASLGLVDRALDDYAGAWRSQRNDACRATRERHEQSPQLLDLRIACLADRREELGAFADELTRATPELVDRAAASVRTLSSLGRCSDAALLLAVNPPPDDAAVRARIDRTRAGLARSNALWVAGKLSDAHRAAALVIAEARAIGYPPLLAEALLRDEQIDLRPASFPAAIAQLREALGLAETGHDQETQLLAWAALPYVHALAGERDAANEAMRHGEALLDGLGRPLRLEAQVMVMLGSAANRLEQFADAERLELRAVRARERLYAPDDPALAAPHALLGNIYDGLGRIADSVRHGRIALDIYARAFGDVHPRTCAALVNLSGALEQADRLAESIALARRAVAGCERAFGAASEAMGLALMNESNALQRLGRFDEALPLLLRAKAISDALGGRDASGASGVLSNLASLQAHRGEFAAALDLIERALAIAVARIGPDSAEVRHQTETKAEILLRARRPGDAIASAERYRQLALHIPDGDVRGRMILGRALIAAGRLAAARDLLAPIVDAAHPLAGKPVDVAAARFELARAYGGGSAERERLERAARDELGRLGRPGAEMLADLEAELPDLTASRR